MDHNSDWDILTSYGSQRFPPDWGKRMTDVEYWQPVVAAICRQHNLPLAADITAGKEGSHAVFLSGDLVIKIYAGPWRLWFEREVESLQALESIPEAKTPHLLAFGRAARGDPQHPYLVMERLPGDPLSVVWDTLSTQERCGLAAQVGQAVRALHSAPVERLAAFDVAPSQWVQRMHARAARCEEFFPQFGLPPSMLSTLQTYLAAQLAYLTPAFTPRLLSADLHGDHILVQRQQGQWRVTGHIDFGDAEVGPVEYEWIALCLDAFHKQPDLMHAFFTEYGWQLPVSSQVRERLKLYTLLFQFPNISLFGCTEGLETDLASLDACLESLWPL